MRHSAAGAGTAAIGETRLRWLTSIVAGIVLMRFGIWLERNVVARHTIGLGSLSPEHRPSNGHETLAQRGQEYLDLCARVITPLSPTCPRQLIVRYLESAGFGHQFSELMFGIYAAQYLGLTFTWNPIVASRDHGDNYTLLVRTLGLEAFFVEGLRLHRAADLHAIRSQNASHFGQWVVANQEKRDAALSCDNSVLTIEGWWHCASGVQDHNCFWAPEHEFLFERFKSCFRAGVRAFGRAFDTCVFEGKEGNTTNRLPHDTVVVAWHLRLGDVAPHTPGDEFFKRVVAALREITRGYYATVQIHLVGGGSGVRGIPVGYMQALGRIVDANDGDPYGKRNPVFEIHHALATSSFETQFLAMMQADVLIGSGSSIPQVASMLSGRPLFFDHVPKHGYGVGIEATSDAVDMDEEGRVLDGLRHVRMRLFDKMASSAAVDRSPCRKQVG